MADSTGKFFKGVHDDAISTNNLSLDLGFTPTRNTWLPFASPLIYHCYAVRRIPTLQRPRNKSLLMPSLCPPNMSVAKVIPGIYCIDLSLNIFNDLAGRWPHAPLVFETPWLQISPARYLARCKSSGAFNFKICRKCFWAWLMSLKSL